eukprot:599135-Prymnesium_polylepis.1
MNGHSGAAGSVYGPTFELRCVRLDVCVHFGGALVRAGRAARRSCVVYRVRTVSSRVVDTDSTHSIPYRFVSTCPRPR